MKSLFTIFLLTIVVIISFAQKNETEKDAAITQWLLANKYYHAYTGDNYLFAHLPKSKNNDTFRLAQKLNIFFADADKVLVYAVSDETKNKLLHAGYSLNKNVAVDVFAIPTNTPASTAKILIELIGKDKVAFSDYAYTESCSTFNDSKADWTNLTGESQLYLSNKPWVDFGLLNVPTHSIDSVLNWRYMHVSSTISNPNIVINMIDGGFDKNATDFAGRVIWEYNFANGNNIVTPDDHGTATASIAAATANNNFGGAGMFDGPIRDFDCGGGGYLSITATYNAYDSIYSQCLQYPFQKQVINMSYTMSNNPIGHSKISLLYNLQNHKQCFLQKGSGNAGADIHIADPGSEFSELTAWGAINTQSEFRDRWSGSNYGDSLDFVADGNATGVPDANWNWQQEDGTSLAAPIGTGSVANLLAQDTSRSNDDIRELLRLGAKDLGTPGFDIYYGWGYARTANSLKIGVVKHVPDSFNYSNKVSYLFTPKYYNKLALNRKCYYPNNQLVPIITNPDSTASFNIIFSTANGFINNQTNTITYDFTSINGCVTTITKSFYIKNMVCAGSISGNLISPIKKSISNVSFFLKGVNNQTSIYSGNYTLACLPSLTNLTFTPTKNNDINKANGVTAVDIALTQSHILGKTLLNSPYKIIAADVNGDGKVTALDIVYMKRLILGIDTTFTNTTTKQNRLWAFVDSSYKFADSTNPFPFKDSISYTNLNANKINQTFIGIKLGDVNWDWNPAIARMPSQSPPTLPKRVLIQNTREAILQKREK